MNGFNGFNGYVITPPSQKYLPAECRCECPTTPGITTTPFITRTTPLTSRFTTPTKTVTTRTTTVKTTTPAEVKT